MNGHVALVCKNCGSPLDPRSVSDELRCPSCGSVTPLEKRQAASLRAHAARIARGIQFGRTAVRGRIMAAQMATTGKRGALLFFGLMLLTGGLVFGLLFLPVALLDGTTGVGGRILGMVWGVCMLIGCVLVLAVPALGVYFYARRITKRASLLARPVTANIEATMTTRCPQCGAQLSALLVGTNVSAPCPYCETPIAPPEGMRDIVQTTLAAMAAQERAAASAEMRQAIESISSKRSYEPKKLPGLDFEFSGAMATGSHDGVPMWSADDYLDASYAIRMEVDHMTGLGGSVWFVSHPVLATHQAIANELGVTAPAMGTATGDQHVDSRFAILIDGDVSPTWLISDPGFRQMLFAVEPDESLLIDGAGLSVFKSGTFWKLTRGGGIPKLLKRYAPTAAWLVRVLAQNSP